MTVEQLGGHLSTTGRSSRMICFKAATDQRRFGAWTYRNLSAECANWASRTTQVWEDGSQGPSYLIVRFAFTFRKWNKKAYWSTACVIT